MTQQHPILLRLFALSLAACGGLWAETLSAQDEGVSVSYSVEPSAITMHEPIIVRFDVLNESTQPITVRLGRDRTEGFSFALKWPDGSAHTRPPTPLREGIYDPGNVTLAPGKRLRHQLLLNEWASSRLRAGMSWTCAC